MAKKPLSTAHPENEENPAGATGYYVDPGPRSTTDVIEGQEGRGAEGITPDAGQVWTSATDLNSLNSMFGFKPEYGGQFFQWLDEALEDKRSADLGIEKKLTPDEANRMFPNMQKPFTESVYPSVAAIRAENTRRQQELRAWMDRGPEMGLVDSFTSGAMTSLDPLNLALGLGASRAFGAKGFVANVAENVAGNLAADVPTYMLQNRAQLDVNIGETIGNSIAGGVAGTAMFSVAGKGLGLAIRGTRAAVTPMLERLPRSVRERFLRSAVLQHEQGAKIEMTPAAQSTKALLDGQPHVGHPVMRYEFTPVTHPSDRAFYQATHPDSGAPTRLATDMGDGLYFTDKQTTANNLAANPDGVNKGQVRSVVLDPEAKILKMSEPLPENLVNQALAELKKAGIDESLVSRSQLEAASAGEVVELLKGLERSEEAPSALEVFNARAKAEGFDGYHFVEGDSPDSQQNGLFLFDESKLTETDRFAPDEASAPRMTPEQKIAESDAVHAPERSEHFDPEVAKEIEERLAAKETPEQVDAFLQEQETQVKKMLAASDDAVAINDKVEAIEEEHRTLARTQGWVKVLAECVLKGFS